jgi:hypothetical protein
LSFSSASASLATPPKSTPAHCICTGVRGRCVKFDPLLGLDFGNVLGDALCAERELARRLSH